MGWSKLFKGEPVPDKDDPRYRERYEAFHAAGGRFARMTGLTWLGRRIVLFANAHRVLFLVLVFGFTISVFLLQTVRFVRAFSGSGRYVPVTERVDSALQDRFHSSSKMIDGYEKED